MDTHDVHLTGEFSKFDEDKQVAFGWASIADIDGKPVVDRQNDVIKIDDLEEAAYSYVLKSRVGGEMHRREISLGQSVGKRGTKPRHVATLIESMVFTPEKIEKMGLPPGSVPNGWWIGFKVHDEGVWEKVKKGDYAAFSIHGKGRRVKKNITELSKRDEADVEAMRELVEKYGASRVAKHLIGRHDQKKHSRGQHGTSADESRLSNRQRSFRAGSTLYGTASAGRNTTLFSSKNKRGKRHREEGDVSEDRTTRRAALIGGGVGALGGAAGGLAMAGARGAVGRGVGAGLIGAGVGAVANEIGQARKKKKVKKLLGDIINPVTIRKNADFPNALRDLAEDITIAKRADDIRHEYDIPVDAEAYDALISEHVLEKRADMAYEGEWITVEEILKAFAEGIESEDEESLSTLMEYLSE